MSCQKLYTEYEDDDDVHKSMKSNALYTICVIIAIYSLSFGIEESRLIDSPLTLVFQKCLSQFALHDIVCRYRWTALESSEEHITALEGVWKRDRLPEFGIVNFQRKLTNASIK